MTFRTGEGELSLGTFRASWAFSMSCVNTVSFFDNHSTFASISAISSSLSWSEHVLVLSCVCHVCETLVTPPNILKRSAVDRTSSWHLRRFRRVNSYRSTSTIVRLCATQSGCTGGKDLQEGLSPSITGSSMISRTWKRTRRVDMGLWKWICDLLKVKNMRQNKKILALDPYDIYRSVDTMVGPTSLRYYLDEVLYQCVCTIRAVIFHQNGST